MESIIEVAMSMTKITAVIAMVLCLNTPATAAMFQIDNPAEAINNPASNMHNPATRTSNPAANIYNPVSRMNNPNALSPPQNPVPVPGAVAVTAETEAGEQRKERPQPKAALPQKRYHLKSVQAYLVAAKKSVANDEHAALISITEDALRRIDAGTLKASRQSVEKLVKYRAVGYLLLGEQRGPGR